MKFKDIHIGDKKQYDRYRIHITLVNYMKELLAEAFGIVLVFAIVVIIVIC